MSHSVKGVPAGFHTITPQLTLDNAKQGIEWYKRAFGAQEVYVSTGPDGKVMHAELKIGDSSFMCNDAMQHMKGPHALGGSPAAFWIYVPDADSLFNRAMKAGATPAAGIMGQMSEQFWGDRCGMFTDPHGYRWTIAARKEDLSHDEVQRRGMAFMEQMGHGSPSSGGAERHA